MLFRSVPVIYTPSTKADLGDHDENISFEQSVEVLEKLHPGKGEEYATKIKDATIALYKKCAEYASLYLSTVLVTTSSGKRKSLSGFAFNQSLTYCLSKDGCPFPASYPSKGQNLELSGVNISSPRTTFPFLSKPSPFTKNVQNML